MHLRGGGTPQVVTGLLSVAIAGQPHFDHLRLELGYDRRTVRVRGPGALDHRQRLLPPRPGRNRPDARRLAERASGALLSTPSWLDQCEIYFSIVKREVVAPNDCIDLDQIRARLAAFEARYNAVATPFNWKFTHRDLINLLRRMEAHQNRAEDRQLAA
jgi:hypothetical protein